MKKFTVLVALALLAATGTGYAVTCAQDNVPAATLLVPYFKVSRNGSAGTDIPEGGVDTMVAITNVSAINMIAHVTVWNKYSAAVLDFNVPLTGFDVATFRMKDILNGKLNVNPLTQDPATFAGADDVCFNTYAALGGNFYRFANPDSADAFNAISTYATPAFGGAFRTRVWDSLDESKDVTVLAAGAAAGYKDNDNPACGKTGTADGLAGDFSGYLTIDVVNYCTNFFPADASFYINDAIATTGWGTSGAGPNVLMGDVFFIDPATTNGNISGDAAVAIEYDNRLDWTAEKTFYNRFFTANDQALTPTAVPAAFRYTGDGREPLGTSYAFRYFSDVANGLTTWAVVWRSDRYQPTAAAPADVNLCPWLVGTTGHVGFTANPIGIATWDEDENSFTASGGGPSGGDIPVTDKYVYLESQRINLAGNADMNPAGFKFGWTRWTFTPASTNFSYYQAYVAVEHTAPGAFVSVGYAATLATNDFVCTPGSVFTVAGNIATP